MSSNPYSAYMAGQIQTQSPESLITDLYNGALRFMREAKEAMNTRAYDKTSYFLGRAQDIIQELLADVNPEAGDVALNLQSLYSFMYKELVEANVKKDPAKIDEVYEMVKDLRDSWEEAVRRYRTERGASLGQKANLKG